MYFIYVLSAIVFMLILYKFIDIGLDFIHDVISIDIVKRNKR